VIHLTLLLAGLVDIATVDEQRLELGDDTWRDEDEVENSEEILLKVCQAITNVPEGEAVQQGQKDMHRQLVVDILGIAEERNVHTMRHQLDLCPH
jgi:hypothetical protein